jgi:hypothetical protein
MFLAPHQFHFESRATPEADCMLKCFAKQQHSDTYTFQTPYLGAKSTHLQSKNQIDVVAWIHCISHGTSKKKHGSYTNPF